MHPRIRPFHPRIKEPKQLSPAISCAVRSFSQYGSPPAQQQFSLYAPTFTKHLTKIPLSI
ncbi:hypothetical protein HNO89_001726 [Sporosarcina luteola]|nr:hypothetical protein [Sporosarcina luteola]